MSRLLVVDDEANIRLLYTEELSEEGYEVITAASITEATEKLQEGVFDLAVLDIKLKNESGIELLQQLVKERHDMPVILCSAFSCYKDDFSAWLADGDSWGREWTDDRAIRSCSRRDARLPAAHGIGPERSGSRRHEAGRGRNRGAEGTG